MEQKKSRMLRLTLMGGQARVFICDTTELAQQARDIHNASNTCSAAMGRMLAATAIMGANLKSEGDRITATINGGGPAGPICAIAGPDGTVKVTIEHPEVELPLKENGKLNVGGALGKDGQLTVMRSFGFGEPYVGRVALVSGEIAEDFANYFTRSEQTPSLVYLGVRVDIETLKVLSAGGMLIQAMPNCPEEAIAALEAKADDISKLALRLEKGEELRDILINMFEGCTLEILGSAQPEYRCDCSRERLEAVLMSLGKEELTDMIEKEGQAELTCRFCNKVYHFTKEQLEAILKEGAGNSDERSDTE